MEQKNPPYEGPLANRLRKTAENLLHSRRIPAAVYRLQFNRHLRFPEAKALIPYLKELGFSDWYASPYLKARKGSLHGYDILDYHQLNPELGTEEEYNAWVSALADHGMGQILDIVPNHMGIAGDENAWWMDVLENGPSSLYADFFDILWKPVKTELENKVLLPILGAQYGTILENQELSLFYEKGALFVRYADRNLPLAPSSYSRVLGFRIEALEKQLGVESPALQEFQSILTALSHLPPFTERSRESKLERHREKEVIKRRLWSLGEENPGIRTFLEENIRIFNGTPGEPQSFDLLDTLLNDQVYRLAHWRVATEEINYRRFFDVNDLAAIRVEDPEVFKETHRLVFKLIREGKVTGLRVDHPDGLYNPSEYLYRLQKACFIQRCLGEASLPEDPRLEEAAGDYYDRELARDPLSPLRVSFYIVGEKILMKEEAMPKNWPVLGTTGYAFLNAVNGLFIEEGQAKNFDLLYARFIASRVNYPDLVYEKKKWIMRSSMASEINTLGHYLNRISEKDRHTRDFTLNDLTTAIVEVIAQLPIYRAYVNPCSVDERDRHYLELAASKAKRRDPTVSPMTFDFLKKVLLLDYPEQMQEKEKAEWLDFTMRFQQLTGPVMAKGLEDTVFYIYNRFISLNEVGGTPDRFGLPVDAFYKLNLENHKSWPQALITTSTHDSKRSEDVRARLNVLSEIPEEWWKAVVRWSRINRKKKSLVEGQWVPERNMEYLFYQTLVGIWPSLPLEEPDRDVLKKRIADYMLKAVREAKTMTGWVNPDAPYEEAVLEFVEAVLSPFPTSRFFVDFIPFQKKIAYRGMFNSLSQALLKITSPGIPDFYQGTEIWDFSLVDPDNRKPVDFEIRRKRLQSLKASLALQGSDLRGFVHEILRKWEDGTVKLYLILKALNYRRENQDLFSEGDFIPLGGMGKWSDHLCAFARKAEDKAALSIVPRFLTRLLSSPFEKPFGRQVWGDTLVVLPEGTGGARFANLFTGEILRAVPEGDQSILMLGEVFAHFPVALLEKIS